MSAAPQIVASTWTDREARAALRHLFDVAVASADPAHMLAQHLPERPTGRCVVVGAGKAAAAMAAAVDVAWPDVALSGLVVVPYGYGAPAGRIRVSEAAHPVPDAASETAARDILTMVSTLSREDLVLVLISGGGSSVMALPADGITLADKQQVSRLLLASGLDIRTMNMVRRRLSAIKGGKLLAAARPARVVTLGISDIPGDDVASIASGPSVPDPTADADLSHVVGLFGNQLPAAVAERLLAPVVSTLAVDDYDFRLIGTPAAALAAAATAARSLGFSPVMLGDDLEGESHVLGAEMARLASAGVAVPTVFLSGGETTVTLAGSACGRGGRNTEFALALACALDGHAGTWALAADTDGEDGASQAAGAVIAPDTIARAEAMASDAHAFLAAHDSATLFDALGDLLLTGPTRTNVNDFRAVLVLPQEMYA
ncbi:glycerate kinase [Sphingomonas sp. NPDC079357]|uniref:glycerate kinase type-2 family protein n=1 Tax=Sphingomonas sp. NPDC079357 TaxID=3364518 RepID=UPI00384F57D7